MPPDHQDNNSFITKIKNLFIDLKNNLSLSKSLKILGIIILLVGLPAGLYLVQQTQIFKPKAATPKDEITLLTEQLLEADKKYDDILTQSLQTITPKLQPISTPSATPQATSSALQVETTSQEAQDQLNSMKGIAIRRKELLLQKIKDNPQEFLDKATLADKINTFPEPIKPYIEEKIQAQGKLTVVHIDDFENKKSRYEYFLEKGDNKLKQERFKLYFVKDPPKVFSGSEVKVKGVELEQQVALSTGNAQPNQEGLQIIAAAILPPAIGEQKTAVLLVNFSDNPDEKPYTLKQIKDLIFDASKSINSYYKENSFDQTFFSGDVFGWYTISSPDCDLIKYTDLAEKAAESSGVYLKNKDNNYNYSKIVLVLAKSNKCLPPFDGMADMGGNPGRSWIFKHDDFYVYTHELGHNLGVHHANKIHCNVGDYTTCQEVEYGDYSDVMGRYKDSKSDSFHFNAPHKAVLGWIPGANQKTVTTDETFILSPLEDNSSAVKVLKIFKKDTNEDYYLSYRQKKGFDSTLPSGITDGVSIHLWNPTSDARGDPYRTKLIDASGKGLYFETLTDGTTFYDNINKLSIKQLSHINSDLAKAGSVTVEIKFNVFNPINYLINSWQTLSSMFQITSLGLKTERPLRDHSLVSYNGYLFNIAGFNYTYSNADDAVYVTKIDEKGMDNGWKVLSNTPIPRKLSSAATVIYKEYVSVIGGLDETSYPTQASSKIYSTKIKSDGTLESWVEVKDKPLPTTRYEHTAVLANDYLFVLGGYPSNTNTLPQDTVYSSRISNNGILEGWSELKSTPLPKGLSTHAAVFSNGYIFVLGGVSGQNHVAQSTVYSAKVKKDGMLENWVELKDTPLPRALDNSGYLSYGEYIFVLGGNNPKENIISNRVYYTQVKTDGTVEKWMSDNSLPKGLSGLAVTYMNGFIFVTGGQYNTYYLISNGYSGKINLPPLPSPSPSPTPFVCNACAADMNKDEVVNILDFSILATCFNKLATDTSRGVACNKADVNNDGAITILDFSCFAIKFNLQCLLGQEKGNSAGLDPETRRSLQAQLLKESGTPPPASSQTIQPSQGERPAAQGTVEPPRSTNLVTATVNLITNAVQGQKRISKAVTKITLLRRSNNQETDFLSTIDLTGLDWGDNFFVTKRYFSDGTAEEVANSSFKITVVPKCQETARDLGQGVAQNFLVCEDDSEKPNGDKYCINGNPDPNNCQQTSQPDQFSEQPPTSQESEQSFSQDNGDGTYTETKDGISKQYRFSDHAEVLGKCRDTDRNNNVIVKVESGRDRVDINCEDLGQRCEEYLNEEGKQDARCIE